MEEEVKRDLITQAKQLGAPAEGFSLKPRTFDEAFRFANLMAESDLLPQEFHGKPANVLLVVQLGMEMGVSPMQALQNIYVVNRRPVIFGDLLPAIVFNSGLLESIHEEGDEKSATCTVKRKGHEAISRTFTWEDAKRAKAMEYGKQITLADKQTYQSYPKRMLQVRARTWAMRDMFADVLKGCAVKEEVDDSIDISATQAEPERKQITQPQPLNKKEPDAAVNAVERDEPKDGKVVPLQELVENKEKWNDWAKQTKAEETATETKPEEKPKKVANGKGKAKDEATTSKVGKVGSGAPKTETGESAGDEHQFPDWLALGTEEEKKLYTWIETCPFEEISEQINNFTKGFNSIAKERQLAFLRNYNDRRQGKA